MWKTIESLKAHGYSVGGIVSREVRSGSTRVGFQIMDLSSGRTGWLAHVHETQGPRVGKYRVNLDDLVNIGVNAVLNAIEKADLIAIDEIGPMELQSENFKEAVKKAVRSRKPVISTVHSRATDELIQAMKRRDDVEVHTVTYENRGNMHKKIIERAIEFLEKVNK